MTNSSGNRRRIAIIGAGPIGLEAALRFQTAGFDVNVYESGGVAENVRDWGHVRLFSPFGMNSSALGRDLVADAPTADALLTGAEFSERYLIPISRSQVLRDRVHERTQVMAIGRARMCKTDGIGNPRRGEEPFQLLLDDGTDERNAVAEVVLDCSGTYPHHRWVGAGGIPCVGETSVLNDADYRLPDVTGVDRQRFAGRTTLVVGGGYSAATAVVGLASLASSSPETRVVWITRSRNAQPLCGVADDPLPERARLTNAANDLALAAGGPVEWLPGRTIHRIAFQQASDCYAVSIREDANDAAEQGEDVEELVVDRVIANVGYRPDRSMAEELQFHECYATQGPIKLAAALLGETSGDCLTQSGHGAATLRNPEPNYFVLGSKSYGRDNRFLIKVGLEQIEDVLGLVANRC